MRYRPGQTRYHLWALGLLRPKGQRPWAPGEGPPKPPTTLFPGSNVRILSSAPQWAFGPNAPPVYPGHMPVRTEPGGCAPPPEQTEQLAAEQPIASSGQNIEPTKEVVEPESADTENQMIRDIPSPMTEAEPVEDEPSQPEPPQEEALEEQIVEEPRPLIYLEDLDPHTQRVIYSAMANAPELGLGPKALFASRDSVLDHDRDELPDPGPSEPRSLKPARKRPAKPININRHEAQCTICKHPERDAIEQAFLHWWRPTDLAYHFKLGHRLVVYRHAKATGLFEKRTAQTTHALGYVIEQAESVTPTAYSIIRAIRALSCIDENGRWHEPRKEVLIMHQYLDSPALPNGK